MRNASLSVTAKRHHLKDEAYERIKRSAHLKNAFGTPIKERVVAKAVFSPCRRDKITPNKRHRR